MRAGIALGSNLGDRLSTLRSAREEILALPQLEPPVLTSGAYETEPVNCGPGAPKFINAVLEVGYEGSALELLRALRTIERALGRPADHPRNASRTLDLDLLYFGDMVTANDELELPHPRMHERPFVLAPLSDIRPALILPNQTRTIASLLADLADSQPLVRITVKW